jgi:hypothetical protein
MHTIKAAIVFLLTGVLAGLPFVVCASDAGSDNLATNPEPRRIAGLRLAGSGTVSDPSAVPVSSVDFTPQAGQSLSVGEIPANEWLIAPIPGYTPVFGATLAVGVAKLYRPAGKESEPRAWMTGGGGFVAENKSWGVGLAHKMGWGMDTWRLSTGAVYADLYYDFYGIGIDAGKQDRSVSLHHKASGINFSLLRKVGSRWFAGADIVYSDSEVRFADRILPADVELPPELEIPEAVFSPLLVSVAPRLEYDSRNSEYYPTHGVLFQAKVGIWSESLGSDFDFRAYKISYNQYFALSDADVLAIRFYGRLAEGDVPFFALSSLGQGSDLRGYTPGRYRDNALLAIQAEYRRRLSNRWYVVAFGGIGGVGPKLDQIRQDLPAGGVGVRFVLAEENHIAMRLDAAWGKDDSAVYLSVGEAF